MKTEKANYLGVAWENQEFENSNPGYRISLNADEIQKIDSDIIKISVSKRKELSENKEEFTHTVYQNTYDETKKPNFNADLFINIPKKNLLEYGADEKGNTIIYASPKKEQSVTADKADYHIKTMVNSDTKETDYIKGAKAWSKEAQNRYFIVGSAKDVELEDKDGNKFKIKRLFLEKKKISKTQLTKQGYLNLSVQENIRGNAFVYRSVYNDDNNLINISIPEKDKDGNNNIEKLLNSNPDKEHIVLEIAPKKDKENELTVSFYDHQKATKEYVGNGWDMEKQRSVEVEKLIDEAFTRKPKTFEKFEESLKNNGINMAKKDGAINFIYKNKWYDIGSFKKAGSFINNINELKEKQKTKEPKQKAKESKEKIKEPKQKAKKGMER